MNETGKETKINWGYDNQKTLKNKEIIRKLN